MSHQGLPVKGYVSQSDDKVALVNANKEAEERILRVIEARQSAGGRGVKIQIEESVATGDLKILIEADVPRFETQENAIWYLALAERIRKELETLVGIKERRS